MDSDKLARARWLAHEAEQKVLRQREFVISLSEQGFPITKALAMLADLEKTLAQCRAQVSNLEGD